MKYLQRLPWHLRLLTILALWTGCFFFGYCGYSLLRPPALDTEQDELDNATKIQKDRDQLNREIGERAYKRLQEKYGDQ